MVKSIQKGWLLTVHSKTAGGDPLVFNYDGIHPIGPTEILRSQSIYECGLKLGEKYSRIWAIAIVQNEDTLELWALRDHAAKTALQAYYETNHPEGGYKRVWLVKPDHCYSIADGPQYDSHGITG